MEMDMGLVKDNWMEDMERGWSSAEDRYICEKCVGDSDLRQLVNDNLESDTCSYCENTGTRIAAPLDVITERVFEAMNLLYQDYDEAGFPWPEDEHGMQNDVLDTYDVLENLPRG
jgi:hypothetical protein